MTFTPEQEQRLATIEAADVAPEALEDRVAWAIYDGVVEQWTGDMHDRLAANMEPRGIAADVIALITTPGGRGAVTGPEICGCGHPRHEGQCPEWRRYPEVLEARQCGCQGYWKRRRETR